MASKWEEKGRPSKTINRPAQACRVVFTAEIEVSKDMMEGMPPYMKDATDFMRHLVGDLTDMTSVAQVIDELRHDGDVTVTDTTVSVVK